MNPPYHSYSPQAHAPPHVQPRPQPTPNPSSFSTVPSHHDILSPTSSNASLHVPRSGTRSTSSPRLPPPTPPPPPSRRLPYYPPLPWYSFTDGSFPARDPRRRRRRPAPQSPNKPVELPPRTVPSATPEPASVQSSPSSSDTPQPSEAVPAPSSLETPLTSHAPSETDSTQPTTPSSAVIPNLLRQDGVPNKPNHKPHPSVPIVPAIPNIPLPSRPAKRTSASITSETVAATPPSNAHNLANAVATAIHADQYNASNPSEPSSTPKISTAKVAPKSWADLVRSKVSNPVNELKATENNLLGVNGFQHPKAASMVEVLRNYECGSCSDRVSFIEPRGLVNTGNMCYMNSVCPECLNSTVQYTETPQVLQILVFCVPFYDLLERLGRRAAHSFRSETPLVDAM
ncbi:MAG: hypothetical protein LQ346_003653 [Caloplaca aetnensis]|nr:MAG: hypothetical protein LQ346_003653 [Caloplaca aetnensis]